MISDEERTDLHSPLEQLTGNDFEVGEALKATTLQLCSPAPEVVFDDHLFCFTGTFVFGSRKERENAVTDRGGDPGKLKVGNNFLVIGEYGTDSGTHPSYGRKIEKAAEWRDVGRPIRIISEQYWRRAL